jgi:serine O-acetyltransferase
VVLHPDCVIGRRCLIGQNVTIGGSFGSNVPRIGDDVWIGPGARILSDISVGSNVIIGTNAVVVRNVPDNAVVAGVPARILRYLPANALDTRRGIIHHAPDL